MKREYEILVNQYGQGVVDFEKIALVFNTIELSARKEFFVDLISLIQQSKVQDNDINYAIAESKLKPTFTPCVMLTKGGTKTHNLLRLLNLPDNEMNKILILLMSLFRIAYYRRFIEEKDNPYKWWYWDLSNEKNIELILSKDSKN